MKLLRFLRALVLDVCAAAYRAHRAEYEAGFVVELPKSPAVKLERGEPVFWSVDDQRAEGARRFDR